MMRVMRIKRFRLAGYSSFKNTGMIDLEPGFNLFIGQNNSGKSALLRSLLPPLPDNRHKTHEAYWNQRLQQPLVHLELNLTGLELEDAFLAKGGKVHWATTHGYKFSLEHSEIFEFAFKITPGQRFLPIRQPPHQRFSIPSSVKAGAIIPHMKRLICLAAPE